MLNLSDKELDRFSKEAAQEYEPGDVLGDRSWDRLQVRLDGDLGRVKPNLLRHIRRFPFYYAPAMLVLLGVSYYLMRRSGSPPSPVVKVPTAVVQNSSSSQSPENTQKSTLNSSAATPTFPAQKAGGVPVGGSQGVAANSGAGQTADGAKAGLSATTADGANAATADGRTAGAATAGAATAGAATAGRNTAGTSRNHGTKGRGLNEENSLAITAPANAGRANAGRHATAGAGNYTNAANGVAGAGSGTRAGSGAGAVRNTGQAAPDKTLGRVALQGLRPTKKAPYINDSALRAFTLKSTAPQLIRKGGAHINRSLEFGLIAAPDFASVSSLAGDRPGSTIGLTVDYQFANHWYVGSGLLLDRKIFAARAQDFHAPKNFYATNGMNDVDLVKGSFEMLEIPLNLRYDFSVTGSTLFFVSGGISSYLMTSENNNYYFRQPLMFRDQCQSISSPDKSYLFSALNLSLGVETGLSNSLSMLIAPYIKIPVRGVGIGQVQMSTVGINFSLKFAPVISRKRY
jgi:hypothetical protein